MKVITLIGADASGKDTQIAHLKNYFLGEGKKVQSITIWDSLSEFSEIKDKKTLQEVVETILLKYEPHARSFFLISCLKNSLAHIDPTVDVVLLNGFYHKYWASEVTYGVESEQWIQNLSQFISSDIYFYLKTPVDICATRKNQWSKYEQGLGKSVNGKVFTCETFQEKLHQNLDKITGQIKNLHTVDGSKDEDSVFKEILGHL